MARLARALLDPNYVDDNAWVNKGRTMFESQHGALEDATMSRGIGVLLGNDLGQMRVQFNFKTYLVEPLYRDDNLFLWDFGDAGQQQSDDQEVMYQAVNLQAQEGAEPAEKPTASNPAGRALAAKVAAALGGEAKLKTIKSVRSDFTVTQKTPQGDLPMTMKGTIVYPDHLSANIEGPMGNITMVATPQAAFMAAPGMGSRDMPSAQKTEMLTQIKRDLIYVGQHVSDPAFIFAANGSEKIGAVDTQILDISGEGMTMRWFIDPQNGHILRETYPTVSQSGPVQGQTDLENWQTTDGVTLPRLRKNKQNGEDSSTVEITKTEFNPTVDAKVFEKPAP